MSQKKDSAGYHQWGFKLHRHVPDDECIPGAKITKIALEDPTEKEMELMSLDKDEKILVLERIRYADGKPVQLELNKFPESFSFLFSENLNDSSLYEILKNII